MATLNAHFDGKNIVPDEPATLPIEPGTRLKVTYEVQGAPPSDQEQPAQLKPGSAKGRVYVAPDFDDPLPEFEEYM